MIDFSRCVGWAIPEGNVVQVADAGGRVLWSLGGKLPGTFYLRPSADIFVENTVSKNQFLATAYYLMINEEVSDGEATCIGVTASSLGEATGTARFAVGGNVPAKINRVTGFDVIVCADAEPMGKTIDGYPKSLGYVRVLVVVEGTSYELCFGNNGTWEMWGSQFASQHYEPLCASEDQTSRNQYEEAFNAIKAYVETNGMLPSIQLEFIINGGYYAGETSPDSKGSTSSQSGYGRVSQAYIVLDCE